MILEVGFQLASAQARPFLSVLPADPNVEHLATSLSLSLPTRRMLPIMMIMDSEL